MNQEVPISMYENHFQTVNVGATNLKEDYY
jgi:hypothetical protein